MEKVERPLGAFNLHQILPLQFRPKFPSPSHLIPERLQGVRQERALRVRRPHPSSQVLTEVAARNTPNHLFLPKKGSTGTGRESAQSRFHSSPDQGKAESSGSLKNPWLCCFSWAANFARPWARTSLDLAQAHLDAQDTGRV